MSDERKVKIVTAIFFLVIFALVGKIAQYFGYDPEPDRTRGLQYQLEKQKQLQRDQQTEQIIREINK